MIELILKRLSICRCGYGVLDDSIKLGTVYLGNPSTVKTVATYRCGKCGTLQRGVKTIDCSQVLHPDRAMAPLPYGLFE
jgi:hypothetical protein